MHSFSVNECAFICYQNACSHAIYVPASLQQNDQQTIDEKKSKQGNCLMEITNRGETCNQKLQRHYYFKNNTTRVVISCLRCGKYLFFFKI